MIQRIYKVPSFNKSGFIKVTSKGTLESYFDVTYTLSGKQIVYVSPKMMPPKTQNVIIPNKSKDVKFRAFVRDASRNWRNIYTKSFTSVPQVCFNIIATTMYVACIEVPCSNIIYR